MRRLLLLASLSVFACTLQAQSFVDNFESYTVAGTGQTVLNPGSFGSWSVTAGSIDLLNNYPGIVCNGGSAKCVDMDGSTNIGGTISRTFTATAGITYTLRYYYSGNQRGGTDTMTATIGTSTVTHTNIPAGQGFTLGTLVWTATTTGTATVSFSNAGGDNVGLILDDVSVSSNGVGTPTLSEWGMFSLTALLVLFGAYKVRANAVA